MSVEPFRVYMVALIAFTVPLLIASAVVCILSIRDTIRQRGKWGILIGRAACTNCGTPLPKVTFRIPTSWHQAMWGGWTCPECGFELDRWSRPAEKQNSLAKWTVLRATEDANQQEHRPQSQDERIRKVNDQMQRGDKS